MTNVQSKLWCRVNVDCQPHLHPWTQSCSKATIGLFIHVLPLCLRLYITFYGFSLLSRFIQRSKNKQINIKYQILACLRSTAFLTTNAFTFQLYNCLVRYLLGYFNRFSIIYLPAFLASLSAILIENPARRPLLTIYVANIATETFWRMLQARGLVRSLPNGQVYVFAAGISILLYLYRLNWHKRGHSDAIFQILQLLVGKEEATVLKLKQANSENIQSQSTNTNQSRILRYYSAILAFIKRHKHASCPHAMSCCCYSLKGGARSFGIAVAIQMFLHLLTRRLNTRSFYNQSLQMGTFLGGFSFIYRAISCSLRHIYNRDDARFALPAALLGSICFKQYSNTTIALYAFWKMLQHVYNVGVSRKLWPVIPGFDVLLYASCTALLFHAAIMEPKTIRANYFKFLYRISGERLCKFKMEPFNAFGYDTTKNMQDVVQQLKIHMDSPIPKCPFP